MNGRSYSATNLNKITANLAGRVCPTNVYVDDTNKVATGRCLYFDSGNLAQALDDPNSDGVSDQTTAGSIRIGDRSGASGKWYEGNIQTCAGKGMRLPVLYETTAANPGGSYKPTDASPTFSGLSTGVPVAGATSWTASAYTGSSSRYWLWFGGTNSTNSQFNSNNSAGQGPFTVRCVVQ